MVAHPTLLKPTPAQEAQETARKAAEHAAAHVDEEFGIGDLLTGFIKFLGDMFKAIFAALTSRDSETAEMPPGERAQGLTDYAGRQQALALIHTLSSAEKVKALARLYQGKDVQPISPLAVPARITSHFGEREPPRDSNGNIVGSSDHKGIDLAPLARSERVIIHSTMPGVVIRSETQRDEKGKMAGYGHWVEVEYKGKTYRYAHLAEKGVPVGTVLAQGDVIGIMGATGGGTGVHLHYEVRQAGGAAIAPEINDRTYARNDRSYVNSEIKPADASLYASKNGAGSNLAALVNPATMPKLAVQNGGRPQALAMIPSSTSVGAVRGG
jgi:murein DD-endopeptidase MepM/ murein hydrolase activator NlpD